MAKEKILVVDDSATQLIMYKMALTKAGYKVISAKNGAEGMNLVETENPDLIVSDIIMPELNGYQFCRLVKDDPSRAHIPIILLTSLGQQQDRFWGIEAGANSFVTKSVDTAELLAEVERLIATAEKPAALDYSQKDEEKLDLSASDNSEESIKSKINRILERLLYESTVSNRMRDLSRYAYQRSEMIRKFFELFEQIVDFQAAGLTLFSGDTIHHTFSISKDVSPAFLDRAVELIESHEHAPEPVRLGLMKNVRKDILNEEKITPAGESGIQSQLLVPLRDEEKVIGFIAVFAAHTFAYNKDIYKLMQLIAKELVLTIRYISKLEEIERIKVNFTSTIVNDLRGPITANQSFVEALYEEHIDPVTEDQKEILKQVLTNNKKLLSFVNDILDISRIDSGTLEVFPEMRQVKHLLDDAERNMEILARQKDITMDVRCADEDMQGFFDEDKLLQVLNNLMSNSIKFTGEGGHITVTAERVPDWPDDITFSVKDTGIGIPEDELPLIFEKYKRTGGVFTSDEHAGGGGVGLGLAICKSIVEAHGGRIWVDSKVGEGSTFWFTIPRQEGRQG